MLRKDPAAAKMVLRGAKMDVDVEEVMDALKVKPC